MTASFVSGLAERYVYDLLKKDFDVFERSVIIKDYMKANGLTQSGFCRKFNVPKTALHTWLMIGERIEEYNTALARGSSKTEAFKIARGDKIVPLCDLDTFLDETRKKVKEYRKEPRASKTTVDILRSLVNELNILHMEIEKKERGK